MSRNFWWAAALLVSVTLIALWPAYSFKGSLREATDNRLAILTINGSVWSGRATIGLSDGGQMYSLPGQLSWKPLVFSQGVWLGIELSHPNFVQPVHLGLGAEGYNLKSGSARVPASWLTAIGAPFNTIQPEGVLQMNWAALALTGGPFEVDVYWRDAQSALASIRPLGDYRVRLAGQLGGSSTMQIRTLNGPLQIEGEGQFNPGQRMQFNGFAWSNEESKAALTGLLSQMGRFEDGRYRLGVF